MSYELSVPLKIGSIEIEFDDQRDLERKLSRLDLHAVERVVLGALQPQAGAAARAAPKKARKKAGKRR